MILKLSKWFFLLLIVSLPLVRPFNLTVFDLLVPYTDFIFLASFGLWVVAVVRRQTSIRFDRLYIFIGLYAMTFTVSMIFSVDPKTSFYKLLGEYYLFALCFLTFNLVQEEKFLKQVVFAWIIGTALTAIASIAGFLLFYLGSKTLDTNYFLSRPGSLPAGDYPRIHALFANANMLCNFLNVSIMLILIAERLGWIKRRTAIILALGILLAGLFSISPGLGGIALSLGIWFWAVFSAASKRFMARSALAGGIILAVAAFASTLVSPDTNNTTQDLTIPFTEKVIEPSVRVLIWESTLETIRHYPWLGIGTGIDVVRVKYETLSGQVQVLGDAHNMWLNILGQSGLFGLAALMLLIFYLLIRCRFKVTDGTDQNYIHIGLSCALLGAFLYQGLNGSFEDARHLWVLIGLIAAFSIYNLSNTKNDILEVSRSQ